MKHPQRGGVIVGIIIGIVIGLGVALAVAVYVTKVPVPFMNKSQTRTPEQDAAESRKNQNWDPNVPLQGRNPARPQGPAASGPVGEAPAAPQAPAVPPPAVAARPSADPLGELANARASASGADPFLYFVQAGAFRTAEDAEAQRAKLSLMGLEARVTEREQSGRQVFRVRIGPFDRKDDAEHSKSRLDASGFDTALVRVQR